MSLLWTQAMAWHDSAGLSHDEAQPISVRHAGFKGYVGGGYDDDEDYGHSTREFDEDLHESTRPEPTAKEQAHEDKHGDLPDSFYERHDKAYAKGLADKAKENDPDHLDEDLHTFVMHHGDNNALWQSKGKLGKVDLTKGVYATQSHVSKRIMDEHQYDPDSGPWHHRQQRSQGKEPHSYGYLGDKHSMFVTHQGRLHATEGHHRVAVALTKGESHIVGWHYDADKHGFPPPEDD